MSWNVSYYQRTKTTDERFWEKVDIRSSNECWNWKASRNYKGYGNFYTSLGNSKDQHHSAHRFSWELHNGEIPDGLFVCHKCDNPSCVNPNHLFLGTNQNNMQDMSLKGRTGTKKGEQHFNSKLTASDIQNIFKLKDSGMLGKDISKMYGVTPANISYILKGKGWKHVTK